MNWEKTMWIMSACALWGYILTMTLRYGVASVVSEYAYRGSMWLFTLCIGIGAVLLMPVLVEEAPEGGKMLGFMAAAALGFVAAAPHYKEEESGIHNAAAAAAGAMAVLWTASVNVWWLLAAVAAWVIAGLLTRKWWLMAEVCGLGMVYAAAWTAA